MQRNIRSKLAKTMNRPDKSKSFALAWIGGIYVGGIIGLQLEILSRPGFQQQLNMRPERAVKILAAAAAFFSGDVARAVLFPAAYGALFIAYLWGLFRLRFDAVSRRALFSWAGLFAVLLILMPPNFADDVVGYALQGRVLVAYHQNPYLHTIKDVGDAWAKYGQYGFGWRPVVPYGPVTVIVSAGAALLGGTNLPVTVGLLKMLMATCCFLTGWLVVKILDAIHPSASTAALFFFLWNPLLLFEGIGHGHNDAVMMALMMIGLYLIVRERDTMGFVAIVFSLLTKFSTAVLLPLHAWWLFRRGRFAALLAASLLSAGIVSVFYLLFYRDPRSFDGIRAVSHLAWLSPDWLGGELLHRLGGLSIEVARGYVQRVLLSIFVVFLLWRMAKIHSVSTFLLECNWVLLFFLLIVGNQINSWYLVLAVPLVAVAQAPLGRSIILLATALPLSEHFRPLLVNPPLWANVVRTLLFYGLLAAILWWHLRRRGPVEASSGFVPKDNYN